jgi:hypothetical protein
MKKIITFILTGYFALSALITLAQSPEQFKYQAVLRDGSGAIIPSTAVAVVIDILQGGPAGTNVYSESHAVTTTAQGVINLNIGAGTPISGTFSQINWSANTHYVKVTANGTEISNGQLVSVPYALSVKGLTLDPVSGNIGINDASPSYKLDVNGVIHSSVDGGACFLVGNDATIEDINQANHIGIYGAYDATVGSIKLGSGGGVISGKNDAIGIGTLDPVAKLDVAGTIRIADGTQGANKVLTSDANGVGTWVTSTSITPAVSAVFPETTSGSWTSGAPIYTGTTLTLPPGKWSVQVSILIEGPTGNSECWVRSSFCDTHTTYSPTGDLIGAGTASGYKAHNSGYGMLIGTLVINNSSPSDKTYYYWGGNSNAWGGDSFEVRDFGRGTWWEDQIIAYPMN